MACVTNAFFVSEFTPVMLKFTDGTNERLSVENTVPELIDRLEPGEIYKLVCAGAYCMANKNAKATTAESFLLTAQNIKNNTGRSK